MTSTALSADFEPAMVKKSAKTISVSVIVPFFNAELYLQKCLDSLATQTFDAFEVICVNDGSTDASYEIATKLAEQFDDFVLLDKTNTGYGHSINCGFKLASGRYVLIVESDDFIAENMLQDLYELAVQHHVDIVKSCMFKYWQTENKEKIVYMNSNGRLCGVIASVEDKSMLMLEQSSVWSMLIKRDFLESNDVRMPETPGASFQDNAFFVHAIAAAKNIYCTSEAYYYYRQSNADSSVHNKDKYLEHIKAYEYAEKMLRDNDLHSFLPALCRKAFTSFVWRLGILHPKLKERAIPLYREFMLRLYEEGFFKPEMFPGVTLRKAKMLMHWPNLFLETVRRAERSCKVSVILPVYNAEKHLANCLDSALAQDLQDIEVICVDDGSTDSSTQILQEYEQKDNRLRLVRQENAGSGAARNKGLDLAYGEFVAFLDADDYYTTPSSLRLLYEAAKENKTLIAGGGTIYDKQGDYVKPPSNEKFYFNKSGKMAYSSYQYDFGFHRFIFSRDLIQAHNLRFPDYRRFQDPPFFIYAMHHADFFYALNVDVYTYRTRLGTYSWTPERLASAFEAIRETLLFSEEHNYTELHDRLVGRASQYCARGGFALMSSAESPEYAIAFAKLFLAIRKNYKFSENNKLFKTYEMCLARYGRLPLSEHTYHLCEAVYIKDSAFSADSHEEMLQTPPRMLCYLPANPNGLHTLKYAVASLLRQSMAPAAIVIEVLSSQKEDNRLDPLSGLSENIQVVYAEERLSGFAANYEQYKDCAVVMLPSDRVYSPDFLSRLHMQHMQSPGCILSNAVSRITFFSNIPNNLKESWFVESQLPYDSFDLIPTFEQVTLLPARALSQTVLEKLAAGQQAVEQDVAIWCAALENAIPTKFLADTDSARDFCFFEAPAAPSPTEEAEPQSDFFYELLNDFPEACSRLYGANKKFHLFLLAERTKNEMQKPGGKTKKGKASFAARIYSFVKQPFIKPYHSLQKSEHPWLAPFRSISKAIVDRLDAL